MAPRRSPRCARAPFDLAMVDINMPRLDGLALIDALAREGELAKVPIVVVSTEASEARLAALQERGIRFVRKPFDPEQLLEAVVAAIGAVS